jgi:hypothetical protein
METEHIHTDAFILEHSPRTNTNPVEARDFVAAITRIVKEIFLVRRKPIYLQTTLAAEEQKSRAAEGQFVLEVQPLSRKCSDKQIRN